MPTLEDPIEMQRPAIVRFGAGQVETLAAWLDATGARRPFVVADRVNAARLDVLGLSGRRALRRGEARARPAEPRGRRRRGQGGRGRRGHRLRRRQRHGPRQARCGARHERPAAAGHLRPEPRAGAAVALAQIPTTAGTGSEVGTRALITDPATMNKIATESVQMLADIAIIDPALTVSRPADGHGRHRRRRDGALRRGLHLEALAPDHRRLRPAGHRARRPLPRPRRRGTAPTSRPAPASRSPPSTAASASGRSTPPPATPSPIRSAPATSSPTASPTP